MYMTVDRDHMRMSMNSVYSSTFFMLKIETPQIILNFFEVMVESSSSGNNDDKAQTMRDDELALSNFDRRRSKRY